MGLQAGCCGKEVNVSEGGECERGAIALEPLMNPAGLELLESNSSWKRLNNTPAPLADICSNKANLFPASSPLQPHAALLCLSVAESVQLDCVLQGCKEAVRCVLFQQDVLCYGQDHGWPCLCISGASK